MLSLYTPLLFYCEMKVENIEIIEFEKKTKSFVFILKAATPPTTAFEKIPFFSTVIHNNNNNGIVIKLKG